MRIRSLLLALTATTGILSAGVLGAHTADALTPLTASITCDSTTNSISTRIAGTLQPNFSYIMKFTAWNGSQVTTGGAISSIPAKGSSVSAPVTTGTNPEVSVAGYTRSWPAGDFAFYTETVRVSVQNSSGGEITFRDATCVRDQRVTVTLDCDQEAHTITAAADGVDFPTQRPLRAEYTYTATQQATADSLTFTRHNLNPPDVAHSVTVPESGTWSDVGYVHTVSTEPYFLSEGVEVLVKDVFTGLVVGRGSASCVYSDHRT